MIDHRVQEAQHVIYEGMILANLLLEQARSAKRPVPSNHAIAGMVRRHTGDHLGRIMEDAGYQEGSVYGVPYYECPRTPNEGKGVQVLVLSDIAKHHYVAYDGVAFFRARKAKDGFVAYSPQRRFKKLAALTSAAAATGALSGAGRALGVDLSPLEIGLVVLAGTITFTFIKIKRPRASPPELIRGYDAVWHALHDAPYLCQQQPSKEHYWNLSS